MADAIGVKEFPCNNWQELMDALSTIKIELNFDREELWYRGCCDAGHQLLPSLMRHTAGAPNDVHDQIEQDLFYGFQAHAGELRERGLSDWEYLFFARHYTLPTRVMDWTDTFGVALYFAVETWIGNPQKQPVVWCINPYALNEKTWNYREIILPKYLGLDTDNNELDFGELLQNDSDWTWDGPVAIYPIQINDRVRAQRGWFTIHGNSRKPLEVEYPDLLARLVIGPSCLPEIREFLRNAGFNRFSIYPDLENLAKWLHGESVEWKEWKTSQKLID